MLITYKAETSLSYIIIQHNYIKKSTSKKCLRNKNVKLTFFVRDIF